jgi:hypothetical protein
MYSVDSYRYIYLRITPKSNIRYYFGHSYQDKRMVHMATRAGYILLMDYRH